MAVAYLSKKYSLHLLTMLHWYCIYTKSLYEDHVSKRLKTLPEIEVFNPKIKRRKYRRGKVREMIEELFPCYIFSRFNSNKYYHMIKYTRGVKRVVGEESGTPYIVSQEIIDKIQSRIKDGFIHIDPLTFMPGDQVLMQEGPFKGLIGIFHKELKARDRVIILLNTIAYQTSLEINKSMLLRA